ncbi:MAG: T9SS type A sorting domain-containing protein, partial [Candidatus Delongbacteria bacterium]|nr:T9SS type A sorting domain-containing protein [Candidatus Delongbacteria bacterium]
IGGFIGYSSSVIDNCFSWAPVEGNSSVAGFIGHSINTNIINCYSVGNVEGSENTSGFIGIGDSTTVNSSYWLIRSGLTDDYAEGRTWTEMSTVYGTNDSTYIDWDFENIWNRYYANLGPSGPPIFYIGGIVGIEDHEATLPSTIVLEQNYPNPFNPSTKISYLIPNGYSDNVKLQIFNTKGELVKTLVNKKQNSGKYNIEFNALDLNSGMYFYTLKTLNSVTTRKMILLK